MDQRVRKHGVVVLFKRTELVSRGADGVPCIVRSVSKTKGTVVVAPAGDLNMRETVDPRELFKDPAGDAWPRELAAP